MDLKDIADRMWNGKENPLAHMIGSGTELTEVADDTALVMAFGNVMPVRTAEGLVLIDTSVPQAAPTIHRTVRAWSSERVRAAVFTHGHIDHVGGIVAFDEEADAHGRPPIEVIAHEGVPARFDRYLLTRGYNGVINQRQFSIPGFEFPEEWRYPDRTYRDHLDLDVGGVHFELHHARGETDDHTWVFLPQRRILYPGDLFMWCVPNAGNPQKVQRYAGDWAVALRDMAARGAELMIPSHGLPVWGAERVRTALEDVAMLLESLHDQTVELMNQGCRLNEILHAVQPPAELMDRPYLQPVYDDPEFIVRNVWRLYGGWYDGNPAELKPAKSSELATELASLAGGPTVLADRATTLVEAGDLRLAGHLAELALAAAPDDPGLLRIHAVVNAAREAAEPSLMARGIFGTAARQSALAARS